MVINGNPDFQELHISKYGQKELKVSGESEGEQAQYHYRPSKSPYPYTHDTDKPTEQNDAIDESWID
jgi:hypothetical protein